MRNPPAKWREGTLGEIIDIFDHIRVPLNSGERAERQGQFPYYGASGIIDSIDDYLFDGEYVLVAEDGENLNSRKLPVAFMARGQFWVNNHAHIIKGKKEIADDRFLIAWFAQANIKGYITGAAQPKLSQANLKRISLTIPPYASQRQIASILSTYDDLIENNTRRIAILESMAQAIYREWFVEFRFPDHEKVKLVKSPLGTIPEGWKVASVKTLLNQNTSGITPTDFPDEDFAHYSIPNYDKGKLPQCENGSTIQSNKFPVPDGCVLISKLNPRIPRIWLPFLDSSYRAIASTEFLVMTPLPPVTREFAYCLFHSEDFYGRFSICSSGTSTSHQRVKPTDFAKLEAQLPPQLLIERFSNHVTPILQLIHNKRIQNRNLRTTRNLLLPKLISGELDVEDLDIEIGEAVSASV